jgi:hypothetical protein
MQMMPMPPVAVHLLSVNAGYLEVCAGHPNCGQVLGDEQPHGPLVARRQIQNGEQIALNLKLRQFLL